MSRTVFEAEIPASLLPVFQARRVLNRDADVNAIVATSIPADAVDFCDVSLELKVHAESFPLDMPAAEVAAAVCERMAAAFAAAAKRINPRSRVTDYAA